MQQVNNLKPGILKAINTVENFLEGHTNSEWELLFIGMNMKR